VRRVLELLVVVLAAGVATVSAQTPQAAPAPNDYSKAETWLCRPGRTDACAVDLNTTIVAANGTLTREAWTASPNAPIDCFYVYPTVSTDQGQHSDMNADAAELNVVRQQFARFGSVCRPYAPLYRQVTLSGLMRGMAGGGRAVLNEGLGYDDVRDAWRYYLEHDNQGRGVVLIGHSQGSYILTELVRQEIDGKPVQSRLVSAILLGATIAVPKGKDVGGAFQSIPLCRQAAQVGCLIAYSSFRATVPPPANTLFGRVDDPAMEAACVNPAALGGTGSGALRSYLAADGRTITGTLPVKPWVTPEQTITTPWVSVPGLLTARCATNEHANYLEITVNGDANDPRVDEITGDIGGARPAANWGLHLIDVNLAQGNLLDIVSQQTKAYLSRR
jgi:pimeloyl-ACP methyl ester carboxylesterase